MAEQAKEKPKGRTLRSVQITGVSFVKKPPDPNCRIKAIIGPKTPTTIEHDPGIECPSCGGSIVERISFKPGTTKRSFGLIRAKRRRRRSAAGGCARAAIIPKPATNGAARKFRSRAFFY